MKNKLVMLVGIAGSGKSSYAQYLLQEHTVDIVVSSDALRAELYGDENDQTHNTEVFNEVHKRIRKALKEGKSVCYDATNLSSKRRMNFLKQISDLDIEKCCALMMASFDDCVMRQCSRERKVPEEVIRKQITQFQCPYWYEGWDDIDIVHTSHIPLEWFLTNNRIPHNNSHHTCDIYTHMIKAGNIFDNFYANRWNGSLRDAVMFHDIGKYFCKEFAEDGEAHYYNHQNVGAYFYLLDRIRLEHLGISDYLLNAILIQWHMEFYLRDEKGMKKLESLLGKDMEFLNIVHECDRLAH